MKNVNGQPVALVGVCDQNHAQTEYESAGHRDS
jgi:hypothetical protein